MTNEYRMPFGKHKGLPLSKLPYEYLLWLRTADLRDPLDTAVDDEYQRRLTQSRATSAPRLVLGLDRTMVEDVIAAGLRSLAPRCHPDTGGSHDRMVSLNVAADWLRSVARGLPV
jgi:hypothetical protein